MVKKLNSFFLMDNTINIMKSLLDNSKRTGKEYGFDLCVGKRERVLKAKNFCEGDKCGVDLLGKCENGESLVGGYHTHPPPFSSRLSIQDLDVGLRYGINCIGTVKENDITCYVKKDDVPFKKEQEVRERISILNKKQEEHSLTVEDVEKIREIEYKVREKCFHGFKIK